jgi:hypothetical protein
MNTAWHPNPIPWGEFPAEWLWYFVPMSVVHFAVFLLGFLVMAVLLWNERGVLARRTRRLALFIGLLLISGSVFNGLWSCLIWDRLYDSTDYVFDFTPFWPITRSVIDTPWGGERGGLMGVSLFQLQLVWLLFAAATWGVTIFLYRLLQKRDRLTRVVEATAG